MIVWWAFFCACSMGQPEKWTLDSVFSPTWARLDQDGNGRLSQAEYEKVWFSAPTFAVVDQDHDRDLSLGELRALTFQTDPSRFFERPKVEVSAAARSRHPEGGDGKPRKEEEESPESAGPPNARPGKVRPGERPPGENETGEDFMPPLQLSPYPDAFYIFFILRDELLSIDPAASVPSVNELERVGRLGSLRSRDAQAILAQLEAESTRLNLDFPASLRASYGKSSP